LFVGDKLKWGLISDFFGEIMVLSLKAIYILVKNNYFKVFIPITVRLEFCPFLTRKINKMCTNPHKLQKTIEKPQFLW